MAYQSKYTGLQIDDILDSVEWKEGKIEDLEQIRAGAQKGATALQSYTEKYTGTVTGIKINGETKSGSGVIDLGTISTDISGKVDKVAGKQLSTEDFTTALKNKLEGLNNYDDTELSNAVETLRGDFDEIVSGDTTTAIKTFNEVIAFLDGLTDTQDLESIIANIEQQIAGKMDTLISGTNIKTINGESILGSGDITIDGGAKVYELDLTGRGNLEGYITEEEWNIIKTSDRIKIITDWFSTEIVQLYSPLLVLGGDVAAFASLMGIQGGVTTSYIFTGANTTEGSPYSYYIGEAYIPTKTSELENDSSFITSEDVAAVALSGSYNDLQDTPAIPSAVTESTVSGWGFTKNAGTYSKPSTGIPKSDLASSVQTSLGKADTALQSYTEQYKGTITGVSANGTSIATSGTANIPAASTSKYGVTKLNSSTSSTSTTEAATPSAVKSAYDLANSYKGTVTSVKVDNVSKSQSSGVVDLGYINKQLSTSTSSSMTLTPNIYYRNTSTSLSTLTITLGSASNSNIINEYFVEFTTRSAGTTVSLPSTIKWANGEAPTFEASTTYQISIVNNLGVVTKFK